MQPRNPDEPNPGLERTRHELRASGAKDEPVNPLRSGIHTRGYLPHVKREGASYFVTFRLADSLPQTVLLEFKRQQAEKLRALTNVKPGQHILERENINTVGDLAATPPSRFRHLRGVGDKTRKEIIELITDLRARFPESVIPSQPALPSDDEAPLVRSVDEIAAQLLPSENSKFRADRGHLAALLDLADLTAAAAPEIGRA